jgi:hypothetical protein
MNRNAIVALAALGLAAFVAPPALAAETGATPAPLQIAAAPASQPLGAGFVKPADAQALGERVIALEKENLVLREDLGKARLDLRTALSDQEKRHAAEMARMQQKIDELNAQLAADRERESRRSRNLWIAVGLLALGVLAAN